MLYTHPAVRLAAVIGIPDAYHGEVVKVCIAVKVEERFYNGTGVAHGGFAATLLDTALGCAINATTPPGKRFTTRELKVNLDATADDRYRRGALRRRGRSRRWTATAEARIVDRHGRIYAHGSTTCTVVESAPAESKSFPTG